MDESATLPSSQAATVQTCSFCGKIGHKASKCWTKNPEQRQAFIERKYGKQINTRKKQGNGESSKDDCDKSAAVTAPIHANQTIAGPSRTRTPELPSKVDSQGTPPRTGIKNKQSRNGPKNKRTIPKKSKPELSYFLPTEKSSLPRKQKATSLNDLPDELVLKILEHFDPCRHVANVASGEMDLLNGDSCPDEVFVDRKILKRICLSSRRLYSIARPILGSLVRDTGSLKRRLMLIERFIRNPIAASHVRIIFVDAVERRSSKMKYVKIGKNILSTAETVDIEEQEIPDNPSRERFRKEDWVRHIQESGNDAKVALMLALLPKLEILHLSIHSMTLAEDFPWTLALMRRAAEKRLAPGTGPFSTLHTILTTHAHPEMEAPGFSPNGIACALGLPTLRYASLYFAWCGYIDRERDVLLSRAGTGRTGASCRSQIDWPVAVSNLETLHFEESVVDSEYLRNILAACKSLRHFTLNWPMEVEVEGSGVEVGYSGLLESLSMQKHSLETLTLDSAGVDWFERWENPGLARIGSFVEFERLHTIEIAGEHIIGGVPHTHPLGDSDTESDTEDPKYEVNGRPLNYQELADIFPPSLETLIINSPGQSAKHFMPLLVEIARACKLEKRLTKLKTVDVEQCFIEQSIGRHQALLDQAAGFFTDAGVVFRPPEFIGSASEDEDGMYPSFWGGSDDTFGLGNYIDYNSGSIYHFDGDAGPWYDEDDAGPWYDEDDEDPYAGIM